MATTVYTLNAGSGLLAWLPMPAFWVATSSNINQLQASTTPGAVRHDWTEVSVASGSGRYFCAFSTPPLSAAVTISGTVTLNIWGDESSMNANCQALIGVYKIDAATGNLSAQLLTTTVPTSEWGTSADVRNWTSAITSTAFVAGDRILITLGYTNIGTMGAGFNIHMYDALSGGIQGDTFVQFTETISFDTNTPAGTIVYPTNTASDISTAEIDLKAELGVRGAGVQTATLAPGVGPLSPTPFQVSATSVRWYTPALNAVTLSGRVTANIRAKSTSAGASNIAVRLFKRTAGGSETDIAWGVWSPFNEGVSTTGGLPASEVACTIPMAIPATVALDAGDRIGIQVYDDDSYDGNHGGANTETLYYAGTSGGASGDTFLTFTQTLTEFVADTRVPFYRPMTQLLAH